MLAIDLSEALQSAKIGTNVPTTRRRWMTKLVDVGRKVRDRRKSLGLTQDDLADLARCSPRFVRALEAGKPSVRLDKLRDVLDVLGLELDVTPRRTS
jgi:y4mF family transcriptional regulator